MRGAPRWGSLGLVGVLLTPWLLACGARVATWGSPEGSVEESLVSSVGRMQSISGSENPFLALQSTTLSVRKRSPAGPRGVGLSMGGGMGRGIWPSPGHPSLTVTAS